MTALQHVMRKRQGSYFPVCGKVGVTFGLSVREAKKLTVGECNERHVCEACMAVLSREEVSK